MIRINLLPEQYRRSERTSTKVFAIMLGAVVLVCSGFGWFGLIYFGELEELQMKHSSVTDTLNAESKRAEYYDALVAEEKEFSKRSKTIQTIASSRMLWTKVLDELIDVVNNNTDRHVGWFTSLNIQNGRGRGGPSIVVPGFVQGKKITMVANFHEDLEKTRFFKDVSEAPMPSAIKKTDKGRYPPDAFGFTLKWTFKLPEFWLKNQPKKRGK